LTEFALFMRPAGTLSAPWREEYNIPSVNTLDDARAVANQLLADWNSRAEIKKGRRRNSSPERRECVAIEIHGVKTDIRS
jgi:hypothetical protein